MLVVDGLMSHDLQVITLKDTLLLIFGTALGSWFRFSLIEWVAKFSRRDYLGTICVNSLSTFLLAIIISLYNKFLFNSGYILFFSVGFIGSLSTFSTFILDIFKRLQNRKIFAGFFIISVSISLSLLCGLIGYWLISLYF